MLELRATQVFRLWCAACTPPKWKYHVVAIVEPRPRFFLINSAVPAFKASRPILAAHQAQLTKEDHDFLGHDSFLDCSELMGGPTGSDLEDLHADDGSVLMGTVSVEARRNVRRIIESSILLTDNEKQALLLLW